MKRIFALICAFLWVFLLIGCTPKTYEITVTCDPVVPGTVIGDVQITVLLNGQPHQLLRADWGVWGENSIEYLTPEDTIQAGKSYQLYVYYPKQEDMTAETVTVRFSQEHGEYHYTEEVETDEQGTMGMMSLFGFDFTDAASSLEVTLENTTVGSKMSDVVAQLRYNGEAITPSRVEVGVWGEDSIEHLTPEDTFFAGKSYQIYIYYPVIAGMASETMSVSVTGENTEHLYTQETELDDQGTMGMMTLVSVDFSGIHQLDITCENAQVGKTPKDVTITIMYNGTPLEPTQIYWSVMGEDEMQPISNKTQFLGGRYYQLYLYYPMDPQVTPDKLTVQLVAENGEHMYAETAETDDGTSRLMSLIGFDFTAVQDNHKHNWKVDSSKTAVTATCTQEGKEYVKCTICGATQTNTVAMKDHKFFMDRILEGNCLTGMRYIEKCSQCGKEQERSRAPGRHTWGPAEYWNNWLHVLTCTICNVTKEEDHTLGSGGYCAICDHYIVN